MTHCNVQIQLVTEPNTCLIQNQAVKNSSAPKKLCVLFSQYYEGWGNPSDAPASMKGRAMIFVQLHFPLPLTAQMVKCFILFIKASLS